MTLPRWITIGKVKLGWFVVVLNAGYPDGLWMDWRGELGYFQPCEFLKWEELVWAVQRRLWLAGLAMEAVACGPGGRPPSGPVELRVLVRRSYEKPKRSEVRELLFLGAVEEHGG